MSENRKQITDRFLQHLQQNYAGYCARHEMEESYPGFITFLIDHELISAQTIKRYTVKKEFDILFPEQQGKKTVTVNTLSDRFNIPERTIWGILKFWEQQRKK